MGSFLDMGITNPLTVIEQVHLIFFSSRKGWMTNKTIWRPILANEQSWLE